MGNPLIFDMIKDLASAYAPKLLFLFKQLSGIVPDPRAYLGKLSFKEEAAGKVRVFAIVDPITQWLFYPLHKHIFAILRRVPMDGTFNQLKPVWRLLRRQKRMGLPLYSLDLSAATDRMPVSIQASLLDLMVQEIPNFGQKWAAILTSRGYKATSETYGINGVYHYSVGQPMGALSSWAMLALTHHFLVQIAAWDAGFPRNRLFQDYAVLGDDLVIGNTKVKNAYLALLEELGMECGLHKSLLSPRGTGLEFAKSTFVDGVNVSPVSFKELEHAIQDLSAWSAFASKFNLTFDRQARILGFGYLARRKSFKKLNHAMQCVRLALVAKTDFKTQTLKLRRGSELRDFDGVILGMFKMKVLKKVNSHLLREMNRFARLNIREMISGLGWKADFEYYSKSHFVAAYNAATFTASVKAVEQLSTAMSKVSGLWKIKTLDQAFETYLKILQDKAVASLDYFKLKNPKGGRVDSALPFQLRLFRAWSRVSHKVIKDFRENQSKS